MDFKTTSTGYKYNIDERLKTDWDFLKAVRQLQSDPSNMDNLENVIVMLLGTDGFERLREHIKANNDGYCPLTEMNKEIAEMMKVDEDIKKS